LRGVSLVCLGPFGCRRLLVPLLFFVIACQTRHGPSENFVCLRTGSFFLSPKTAGVVRSFFRFGWVFLFLDSPSYSGGCVCRLRFLRWKNVAGWFVSFDATIAVPPLGSSSTLVFLRIGSPRQNNQSPSLHIFLFGGAFYVFPLPPNQKSDASSGPARHLLHSTTPT